MTVPVTTEIRHQGGITTAIAVQGRRSPGAVRETKARKSRPKGIVVIREKASRGSAKGLGTPLARKAAPGRQDEKPCRGSTRKKPWKGRRKRSLVRVLRSQSLSGATACRLSRMRPAADPRPGMGMSFGAPAGYAKTRPR
jgi:hypothetical protein